MARALESGPRNSAFNQTLWQIILWQIVKPSSAVASATTMLTSPWISDASTGDQMDSALFINNMDVSAADGGTFERRNPLTGAVVTRAGGQDRRVGQGVVGAAPGGIPPPT